MAKIQTGRTTQKVQRGAGQFDGKAYGVCGAKTRRTARPTWWVCETGHRLVRKDV